MELNQNALTVLKKRYLKKDRDGNPIEKPEDMFRRVADAIAQADRIYDPSCDITALSDEFFRVMTNLEFLPNSPTLMNAGRPLGQLSACFVLPIEDSMEGIFETVKRAAIIHKSGGGTGFSFSRIRPKGSEVNSTGGVASGPVSFMKVFNAATEAVKQGGTRRGANMGILRVDHPDILEFISCKENNQEITNFNISVGITEQFMEAVEKNENYDLIDPHDGAVVGQLNASEIFDKIVSAAWQNGEPGIIFLDRLNKDNVVPDVAEIESTNPCGEQPLLPYESCNLGSINLLRMLKKTAAGFDVDYKKLEKTVKTAVHFLDNVIDVNKYPIEEIDHMTKQTRKIGLGVMGFADMLYAMEIPYNSNQSVELAEDLMRFIDSKAKEESAHLAELRGTFPLFDRSIYANGKIKYRNATVTTIAPTGTLSIIAGVSSGIEPSFALSYIRNVMDGTEMVEVNPIFLQAAQEHGFYSEQLMSQIAKSGHIPEDAGISDKLKKVFVTAHDISPLWHTKMQAAFQKYVDNAVSKTVNFKSSATKEEVREVFVLAYQLGCKGVTIYRDGSRDQVLNIGSVSKGEQNPSVVHSTPRERPTMTRGITERYKIGCGNLYVTVNFDENGICEVFTNTGKSGGCPSQSEATGRLASIALRSGMDPEEIIDQLRGIRCLSTIRQKGLGVTSCPDAIGRALEKVLKYQRELKEQADSLVPTTQIPIPQEEDDAVVDRNIKFCPECGMKVAHEGGCVVCRNCGFSKCG